MDRVKNKNAVQGKPTQRKKQVLMHTGTGA